MLWRFLLAAVAVSCTLSRTHANGPRDRIKDLTCVLLLSGMQKEDLDVNLLNKLQRYNVNIHDMNNEDLLQECMTLRNKSNRDMINTTTNANLRRIGLSEGILQENENSPQTPSNPAPPDSEPSMQTDNTKPEMNNDTIKYADGKPKLDSVLKFWQDMKLKTTETPKNNNNDNIKYISEPKNKRNVQENSDSNEEDDIKKLLESYFSKRQHNKNKHNRIVTTTTSSVMDNIYKQLLRPRPDIKNNNFEVRNFPNILPLDRREAHNNRIRLLPIEETKPYYGNFSEILDPFNRFNTNNEDINRYFKDKKILSDNPYLVNYIKSERLVSTTERETEKKISVDMIKEIANSVKEIILRDLKLNIQETSTFKKTTGTPTTARITKATLSPMNNNLKIQESVLNKFLEMFEEIKTLKKNNILISSNNNKQNVQILPRTFPLGSMTGMESPKPTYNNPYQIQYPGENSQNLNFLPQEHKFRSNEARLPIKSPPKPLIPITFQTNNLEIPPLGIPINKPENPINQNIIVTSEVPYRIGIIKNNLKPRNNPFADLIKFDEHTPKQSHTSKSRDHNFNVPTNYDVRFTSNKHHPNYYDKIRPNNFRPRSENLEYIKTPEEPQYHERLENVDFLDVPDKKIYTDRVDCCNEKYAYSKKMVDCCNRKIASRQQMSLNNMKKGKYDDTHFKNFLKTQQKVTDMLERILGTRDTVRSVETT